MSKRNVRKLGGAWTRGPVRHEDVEVLLSLRLLEVARSREPLVAVMDEISRKAQERGLTPQALQSILDEE